MYFSKFREKCETGIAFLLGSVVAGAWFVTSTEILDGAMGQFIPIAGAIALAGIVPHFLIGHKVRRAVESSDQYYSQRLSVLDRHVLVNVVDNKNLLTEVNQQFLDATGFTRDALIGMPVNMLYHDGAGRRLANDIRSQLVQGKIWQGETPLRRADGSVVFTQTTVMPLFDGNGNWSGSISARTDVTGLNELMAEHETVETLDELRDDIWILDADTECFTYLNKSASNRLGWNQEEAKEQTIKAISDQAGLKAILQSCKALKGSKDYITHFETTFMGTPFYVSVKFLRVAERSDRFLIMMNDMTERLAEERAKAEFISTVSHELRSPLTSIKGSMGLLLSKAAGELPEKALSLLEIAHRNADRLVLIINDILDLEKISSGHMEFEKKTVDLCALVQETNEANAMLCQRFALNIQTEGLDEPLFVDTDPNRIIQVLTNLLTNAFKFSRPGGSVTVKVRDMPDQISVSVTDEGPGIPPKDQHKIFERFADLENSERANKGGTGLGLSICQAIIENLGGSIGFDTKEGVGTSFYFILPKTEGLSQNCDSGKLLSKAS